MIAKLPHNVARLPISFEVAATKLQELFANHPQLRPDAKIVGLDFESDRLIAIVEHDVPRSKFGEIWLVEPIE